MLHRLRAGTRHDWPPCRIDSPYAVSVGLNGIIGQHAGSTSPTLHRRPAAMYSSKFHAVVRGGAKFVSARAVLRVGALAILACCASVAADAPQRGSSRLDFQVQEGLNINSFVREGPVAAHLVLRSGTNPRVLVAFPAGNSAVGLWFEPQVQRASWTLDGGPRPVREADARHRPLYGISEDATIQSRELRVRQAVLSSTRVLRDYQALGSVPASVAVSAPDVRGNTLTWSRDRLDGAPGYRLRIEVLHGQIRAGHILGEGGHVSVRITGLTGETPLTPLVGADLLRDPAGGDDAARNTLSFLAYQEKLLAGSWRFNTYFGRDTLISTRLLMPALASKTIEAGLSSVLARLSGAGEVAHEEDIGERAILDHVQSDGSRSAAAVFDYKMIDGNYLLAPVMAAWLALDTQAQSQAEGFLAASARGTGGSTETRGEALVRNLRLVLQSASGFAAEPTYSHLISLKPGVSVGDWRDSEDGIGGGRYPYDVNAVLVPAALEGAARLSERGLLTHYLQDTDRELFARARQMATVWRTKAPPLFDVTLPHRVAISSVAAYATSQALEAPPALAALGTQDLRFHAIALDASGRPIPVMHSDEGFALLFEDLEVQRLDESVVTLMRPFPAGLMTGAGMLVANPAFAAPALQARFTRNAYHGTVVWSWQQALFAAGLQKQLRREDLPPAVRDHLLQAQKILWSAIEATRPFNNSELWSWSFSHGHYEVAPFGAAAGDADESNAAQLWSTVYLAVRQP